MNDHTDGKTNNGLIPKVYGKGYLPRNGIPVPICANIVVHIILISTTHPCNLSINGYYKVVPPVPPPQGPHSHKLFYHPHELYIDICTINHSEIEVSSTSCGAPVYDG